MKLSKSYLRRLSQTLYAHRVMITLALVGLAILVTVSWFIRLATLSTHRIKGPVLLDAYGLPGLEITLVYPTRLSAEQDAMNAATITVYARALSSEAVRSYELALTLPNQAIAFVDARGEHIGGRLALVPGYPDAAPRDLRVAHGNTQFQGRFLRPYRVTVQPMLRVGGEYVSLRELAFSIALESRFAHAARSFAVAVSEVGMPYLLMGIIVLLAVLAWQRWIRWRYTAREQQLATTYLQLREDIRLERWPDARRKIEQICAVYPRYRDVNQLDALVSAAETAAWRREQLYNAGVRAYRERNWSDAVQYLSALEQESPYYRDVRFLRRTAALYADLTSRDRSLRAAAAKELGQVADLLDIGPLVRALGDKSKEVADAAEASLRIIGPDAFDMLLGGLIHESAAVRERARRLIESFGQEARPYLVGALRSTDVRVTRVAAELLVNLGARKELAESLLWIAPEHQESIVNALLGEGAASCDVLVDVLLRAPADRQQIIVNALAALREEEEIDRHLQVMMRATRDAECKELLQRVLKASPAGFYVAGDTPAIELPAEGPPPEIPPSEEKGRGRRLRLLDRLRS